MHRQQDLGRRDTLAASSGSDVDAEDDLSSGIPNDYDSSPQDGEYSNKNEKYYDDAESGVSRAVRPPPDLVHSLHSALLERRSFPYASALCSAFMPVYYTWGEPSLFAPLGLASFSFLVRHYRTFQACDALHWETARRKLDGFARSTATSSAETALEGLEVLAYFHAANNGGRGAGAFRSYEAEPLVRIARDPRLRSRLLRELRGRERRRRAGVAGSALAAAAFLGLWGSWYLAVLVALTLIDLCRDFRAMREADRLAAELYSLATENSDAVGLKNIDAGDGCKGGVCYPTGKSWGTMPLFAKLQGRSGWSGGRERRSRASKGTSNTPAPTSVRSARRRRIKGNTGRAAVI